MAKPKFKIQYHGILDFCRCLLFLIFLVLPLVVEGQTAPSCKEESQRKALLAIYEASGGPQWENNVLWNTDQTCNQTLKLLDEASTKSVDTFVHLPSFCCWAGVDCCVLAGDNDAYTACGQYRCNCTVRTVTGLSLGRNRLRGRLEDILNATVLDGLACSLRKLFLGGNALTGTVPPQLTQLADLRILALSSNALSGPIPPELSKLVQLEELDLSNNNLTGQVPTQLCGGPDRISRLRDLILSNNILTGNLVLPDCEALIYLDVQNNQLSGPIIDIASYRQLHILRLGNNRFNGTVSLDEFDLRLLVVLDLSLNRFSGPLPNFVGNSSQLTIVRLFNNNFTGKLPANLFSVGTLSTFLAYGNNLSGTLPDNIGDARGISGLSLRGNNMYGTLPASLASLARTSAMVDLSLTHMSCCGYDYVPDQGYRYFNLSAPRLPPFLQLSELARPVMDTDIVLTNMRCPFIVVDPATTNGEFLAWALDPEYYLYQGCTCTEGYDEVWTEHREGVPSMGRTLSCLKTVQPWYEQYPWGVVLIVLGTLLGASWMTYSMCFRRGKNAAVVHSCFNLRKRLLGEPVGGQVSIAVTDIEGYSDLMKQSPELMTRALSLHNAIVRKARWTNFGYTLEQEGDSFALVFYEAQDAVNFCLQTQLALNRLNWPEGLFSANAREHGSAKRRLQAPSLLNTISVVTNNLTLSLFGARPTPTPTPTPGGQSSALLGRVALPDPDPGQVPERSSSSAAAAAMLAAAGAGGATSAAGAAAAAAAAPPPPPPPPPTPPTPSTNHSRGHPLLFNGLRVRMGVATGTLPPGSCSKGSAVMDLAKMVSDMAHGGQILMDEITFRSVKERMEEFGAVDHNGLNFKRLNSMQPPWSTCLKRTHLRNPDEALLLDMGEYTHCPGCKRLPLFQLEATSAESDTPGPAGQLVPPLTPKGAGRRGRGSEALHVYQILSPALLGRAKAFGNRLALKEEWFCSDSPYFEAPGTLEAPLESGVSGPLQLPSITMAFAIMEGGKTYTARHRRDVRRVNDVAAACIRACLRLVGPSGSYLCRLQDGDLKYMVAFASPEVALEWSLLLQDVLMYADWPDSALKHWREEYDDRGRLVFRGPRIKIGLCEGVPRSIVPDHAGRADYHGDSINQAARYMDAAAHGGMVALEASLAVKVLDKWREATAAAALTAHTAANVAATAAMSSSIGRNMDVAAAATTSAFATAEASTLLTAAATPVVAVTSSSCTFSAKTQFGGADVGVVSIANVDGALEGSGSCTTGTSAAVQPLAPVQSRVGTCKGQMAAVQETEAAGAGVAKDEPSGLLAPAAASRPGANPAPLAAVLSDPASAGRRSSTFGSQGYGSGNSGVTAAGLVGEATENDGATAATADSAAVSVGTAGGADGIVSMAEIAVGPSYGISYRNADDSGLSCDKSMSYFSNAQPVPVAILQDGLSEIATGSPLAAAAAATSSGASKSFGNADISPPRQPPAVAASSSAAIAANSQIRTALRTAAAAASGSSCATHVTFATREQSPKLISHAVLAPASRGPPSTPTATTAAAAAAASQVNPTPSDTRSPRPPALAPLALPSDREVDEALRASRAAVEAAKRVQVDGPADARYQTRVFAFRIGFFRFKGNPEPIHMAHVVLEHLAGRRFPADAPKGKGAKVGDSSGLLNECDTTLPDLASILRDRQMLLNGHGQPAGRHGSAGGGGSVGLFGAVNSARFDSFRSSPSRRPLRIPMISRNSMGRSSKSSLGGLAALAASAAAASGGSSSCPSPRSSGGRFGKAHSIAAGAAAAAGRGGGSAGGLPSALSGSVLSPSSTAPRDHPTTPFVRLANLAAASMRWASGGVAGGAATTAAAATAANAPGVGAVRSQQLELQLPTATAAGSSQSEHPFAAETPSGVVVGARGDGLHSSLNPYPESLGEQRRQGPGSRASDECESHGSLQLTHGRFGCRGSGGGGGDGTMDARVIRPSPLRFMSGRDDPVSERHSEIIADAAMTMTTTTTTMAVSTVMVALDSTAAGTSADTAPHAGDDCV